MKMPTKYPPCISPDLYVDTVQGAIQLRTFTDEGKPLGYFSDGNGAEHAHYLYDLCFRHPIMYYLFYRWWVPSLLVPEERARFDEILYHMWRIQWIYTPHWAEFAKYHPVQFMLLLLGHRVWRLFRRFTVVPILSVYDWLRSQTRDEYGVIPKGMKRAPVGSLPLGVLWGLTSGRKSEEKTVTGFRESAASSGTESCIADLDRSQVNSE